MNPALLDILRCPSCRAPYELHGHAQAGDAVMWGYLQCRTCAIVVPIVQGFPLFSEPLLHAGLAGPPELEALSQRVFGAPADYRDYVRAKAERGGMEIYAAFQPFNESTRAMEPLLDRFTAGLGPGDLLLDPWCRTGWSAEWLAQLCPDQTIVALWPGERSVLGYRGFAHWLSQARRAANIEILFVEPERGLPFADQAFSGVYALDAFHRFDLIPFAGECLRVADDRAAIALAHLHLSNSEPDPYFDRGGRHWHGRDYAAWACAVTAGTARTGLVFSEADLFEAPPGILPAPNPDTDHYNGFVFLAPAAPEARPPRVAAAGPDTFRLLVSPLFRILFGRRVVRVDGGLHDGAVAELLERHPIYHQRLPTSPVALADEQFVLLALAIAGRPLADIAAVLGVGPDDLDPWLDPLEACELVRRVQVSAAGIDLQRFHANQLAGDGAQTALDTWLGRLSAPGDIILRTADGGELSAGEARDGVELFAAYLRHRGLAPGDSLGVTVTDHPLGLLMAIAGAASGLDVVLGADALARAAEPSDFIVAAAASDLIGRPSGAPLGLQGEPDSVLAWIGEAHPPPPISAAPTGQLSLMAGRRPVTVGLETLTEAALGLGAASAPLQDQVADIGQFVDLLACLVQLGRGGAVQFTYAVQDAI